MSAPSPEYRPNPYPYQPVSAPVQPPRKKRRVWTWVLVGILALFGICGGIGIAMLGGAAKAVHDSTTASHTITYKITGKSQGKTLITYIGNGFSESQNDAAKLPWSTTIKVTGWQPVTISAQITGSGTVTCEIDVDGHPGKPSTSTGESVIASCTADTIPGA